MAGEDLKISVVVPLYNKTGYVIEALESVFAQTYAAHEVIVVDDGSTDDGAARVRSIAHPTVHLIQQANAGVAAARNTGIRAATGELIAFLDADDRYLPGFLAAIVQLVHDFPAANVFGTGYRRFSDQQQDKFGTSDSGLRPHRGIVKNFYAQWCRSSFVSTSSIAVSAAALHESGIWFPVGERLGEDQDVWFRLAERYEVAYESETQSEYRVEVIGSATHLSRVSDLLPCYQRLASRLVQGAVPSELAAGAQRLLASHYLNVARARLSRNDIAGATELVLQPASRANPVYFLRTLALVGMSHLGRMGAK